MCYKHGSRIILKVVGARFWQQDFPPDIENERTPDILKKNFENLSQKQLFSFYFGGGKSQSPPINRKPWIPAFFVGYPR
jgi:hypothetical protein